MQIELLETFLDLMETASFNRTAERLGVTQSTVSARVQSLETALGRKLFTRSRAGTQATAAGQRFADHARLMRHEWNEARRDVRNAGDHARALRIGLQNELATTHLSRWVAEFRQAIPDASFYVELDYSTQMSSDILIGELDMAVLFSPRHIPDIHYESIGEMRYVMVSTEAFTVAELRPERTIMTNFSPAFGKAHRQMLPELASAPVTAGHTVSVCELLTHLGGSAFVHDHAARDLIDRGICRAVNGVEPILQPAYFAVHVRNRHSHVHRKLLSIVRRDFAPPPAPAQAQSSA
ncbi:DNA-binding transcriptional LysR family regulator [Hoeflea marina]|uniref:DNA-binding transcriptional LysR family regulator n=1 Tax=Hoeflea marina TaxID=274592 RepID=A0A317PHT4_9HYPH|nr:LysR family transcriptional regulator [Hoeflea marina]PWV99991.1 DNA-binding transcriptional LysR family regulator [Hoeflea marina]